MDICSLKSTRVSVVYLKCTHKILILLSSIFDTETEQDIFDEVLNGDLDFKSEPWPKISDSVKDLVRKMLDRDPKKRLTAHDVLCKSL